MACRLTAAARLESPGADALRGFTDAPATGRAGEIQGKRTEKSTGRDGGAEKALRALPVKGAKSYFCIILLGYAKS